MTQLIASSIDIWLPNWSGVVPTVRQVPAAVYMYMPANNYIHGFQLLINSLAIDIKIELYVNQKVIMRTTPHTTTMLVTYSGLFSYGGHFRIFCVEEHHTNEIILLQ